MKLIFTDQYANILLLLNGLAIIFYLAAKQKNRRRAMKFGNYETLQKVAGKNFLKSSNILLVTRILALTALIVGISQPVLVQQTDTTNSDFVIAIDSSTSMLSTDFSPSRLEASKQMSSNFISELPEGTQVGVLSFAGTVKKEQDMTDNRALAQKGVETISLGEEAGTAIGNAISTGTSMLLNSNKSRKIFILADGESTGEGLNESIGFAVRHNVSIYTIGLGKSNVSSDRFGEVNGVNATRADYPNLNTDRLSRIANTTGGEFVVATNKTSLGNAFIELEKSSQRTDISQYFIFLAALMLLVEWILGSTKYSIIP